MKARTLLAPLVVLLACDGDAELRSKVGEQAERIDAMGDRIEALEAEVVRLQGQVEALGAGEPSGDGGSEPDDTDEGSADDGALEPAGASGGADPEPAPSEVVQTCTVVLKSAGSSKLSVIKGVKAFDPALGLKEAKELVDSAPSEVWTGLPRDEASVRKAALDEAGAEVTLECGPTPG